MKHIYSKFQNLCKFEKVNVLLALLFIASFQLYAQKKSQSIHSRITSASFLEDLLIDRSNSNYIVTSEHISSISGIKHTYVRQAVNGLEVLGTESSLHVDNNGKIIKAHVNFVDAIHTSVNSAFASITAEQAITNVAQQMGYTLTTIQLLEGATGPNQKGVFNGAGISNRDIPVKLMYYFQEELGTKIVWELSIMEKNTPDWWNFRVDATTGRIIDKVNWTVNCKHPVNHSKEGHKSMPENRENNIYTTIKNLPIYTVFPMNNTLASSYSVFPLPMESPYIGTRSLEVDPDDPAASPLGWHDDGTSTYAYTKGNNVSAYDDGGGDDTGSVADHAPESAPGLIFDYPLESTSVPDGWPNYFATVGMQSEEAAITNLFYWNNIIHDITYHYGFDDVSGNFQEDNGVMGGLGGDSVNAEAQDEADLAPTSFNRCNANFGTPPDGLNPRMQMYICDGALTAGHNDGDFDNIVIIHEFAHGISNRLTGGPADANALNNAEQMGEGWSDFYGYMLTMDAGNATSDRVVGTFLFDQGPGGPGIRLAPYSTSLITNPFTYGDVADPGVPSPHGIGFIWASMLYELTQALITDYGFDPDLYTGTGGNNIALMLVTEGMKIQPTFPGFVDGRDAILAADLAINGGVNECLIWTAFAKRGLGFSASQGSSFSRFDGIEAFDVPSATLIPSRTSICISEGVVTGLSGGRLIGGVYSGANVTDAGDGMTFSFDAATAGLGDHTVTYSDPCTVTVAMETITVTDGVPVLVCQPATLTLDGSGDATLIDADVVANLPPADGSYGYTVDEAGTFAPETITGTSVVLGDDVGTAAISIGFGFDFFGTNYTDFYIASNGFVSFTGNGLSGSPSWSPTTIPMASDPNGMVAVVWDDLSPNISGTIRYELIGIAPNRKLVVDYDAVPLFSSASTVTTQLQLHEGTNIIEIHTTLAENNGGVRTQGIENAAGDEAYTATGRNLTVWTATSDYVAFIPTAGTLPDNCGNPVAISLSQSAFTCQDIGDVIVTVTVDDGMGGINTCDATVTIIGPTTTFAAGSWDVAPHSGAKALFSDDYDTDTFGDVTACSCEIETGNTVTVNAGGFLDIAGHILVDGTLDVEHEGSVVQRDATAVTVNNGSITVTKTTPALADVDFSILGSPMTVETREGVYTAAAIVRNHITGNFVPYSNGVPAADNWADDNGDNWLSHTGLLDPGVGYLVKPNLTGGGSGAFTTNYTLGTLNSGSIDFSPLMNGGVQANSPNILSNPYASALDIDAFLTANGDAGGAVYFWEHNTAPDILYPGYAPANYDMDDISNHNGTIGTAAASGGSAPTNEMPSGQGFGIKPAVATMITFTNAMRLTGPNTGYRNSETLDVLRLQVSNVAYDLQGNMALGFTDVHTNEMERSDIKRLATSISVFSIVDENELGIQMRSVFTEDQVIPIGFHTFVEEVQTYTISLGDLEGELVSQATVYLNDHLLNTQINLSETDYTFTADVGYQTNRFELVFIEEVLGVQEVELNAISIYPNPTNHMLNIISPLAEIQSVEVVDVQGRKVNSIQMNNQGIYQIDMSPLASAMYFIKINTESGSILKRVVKE